METPHVVPSLGLALEAIGKGRDAIGLATDGGYWVIALGAVDRGAFDGVPMSRSHTGLTQLRRLHSLGRSVTLLPAARDLDTFDDLVDAANRSNGSPQLRAVANETIASVRRREVAGRGCRLSWSRVG